MAGTSPGETNSWIGRTVSGVRLERLLGRGGMAEVFLGHHLRLGRPVAVKILHARVREDPNLLKLLESEAAALTSMQHPNIVRCLDCNVVDGRPYIVLELLDGITLHDRLDQLSAEGLLPPLHVVERLIRSTADALDHAHARGVIHRDLKPANIMLLSMGGPIGYLFVGGNPVPAAGGQGTLRPAGRVDGIRALPARLRAAPQSGQSPGGVPASAGASPGQGSGHALPPRRRPGSGAT